MTAPDMQAASDALALGIDVINKAVGRAASLPDIDDHQSLLYDIAHAASAIDISRSLLDYGSKGINEGRLACAFIADTIADLNTKLFGRESSWGVDVNSLQNAHTFISTYRSPEFVSELATLQAPNHLDQEFEMVADTFRRFGEDKIAPQAEHIHREDADIPEDIIEYLAKHISTNIRELEGAIISLIAQSSFNKKEITLSLAKDIVEKFVKNTKREVSIDYIQKVVSDYFQMDIGTLQSKTRKRHIVQARQLAMFFAKKFTKASLASIGSQIGKRDHATVLHACKTVDNLSTTDKQFRKYVEDLTKKLSV